MLIRSLIVAASMVFAPGVASAQTATAAPLPLSTIEQRLTADGFRIVEIERYSNSVEVKGYDRTGQCVELHLNPLTGEVIRSERDDDCARGDERDRDGRH